MRTPINNIGIFDGIPAPRYTNKKERSMTELAATYEPAGGVTL